MRMDDQSPNKRDNGQNEVTKLLTCNHFPTKHSLVFGSYLRNHQVRECGIWIETREDISLQLSFTQAQFRVKKEQTRAASKPNPTRIQPEYVGVVGPYLPIYLSYHYEWDGFW